VLADDLELGFLRETHVTSSWTTPQSQRGDGEAPRAAGAAVAG
jgi:hypothetical protein